MMSTVNVRHISLEQDAAANSSDVENSPSSTQRDFGSATRAAVVRGWSSLDSAQAAVDGPPGRLSAGRHLGMHLDARAIGNLGLHWFVRLDLDQPPWDHSWFSKNRARRFTKSGLLERLCNATVALTMA